ncbi:MAG: YIP1 family protein [Deltaproteobacteria bacterium]|nr:YIP1 family protein [Deltaproteobacteria bacterium]
MPTFKCPQCGGEFQAETEGRYHCPHCDNTIAIHLHMHGKIPWESWREKGRVAAFFETWKQVMSNPVSFFKRVPVKGNFVLPMYFGIICQSVAIILMWSYQAGFHSIPLILDYSAAFGGYWPWTAAQSWPSMTIFFLALLVVAPIFALIGILFTSAVYHSFLKIFSGASHTFEATFRAVCYASSAQFLGVIPIVGAVIAGVWLLVLSCIGIKVMHQTSYLKAIFSVIIPLVLSFVFIALIAVIFFSGAILTWIN